MKKLFSVVLILCMMLSAVKVCAASDRMVSTADFTYKSFDAASGRVKITFDICANTLSDGIVGIAGSHVTPKNYSDYAICFRIRAGGFFDSNNASSFDKAGNVTYVKNTVYRVEIEADTIRQIYNAFVYVNGEKKTVADNYAFRASSSDLGKITARGGGDVTAGLYYIENITVTQENSEFETFELPNLFGENMVFQRGVPCRVFGRGNGEITAKLERGDVVSEGTVMAQDGEFLIELPEAEASVEPYTLTVAARDRVQVIENVFVGDVYLLAGQSNMAQNYEHQTNEQLGDGVNTGNMPKMITDERIKFFKLERKASGTESFDVPYETDGWQPLNDSTKKKLSYIGMYFANERLEKEPDVPIGLMSVAWRGTTINRWMRKSDDNKTINYTPTSGDIFNNHIAPLTDYPVSAVLWYQGESDSKNPVMYEEAFKTLITDWRRLWNDEDLPFLFVQLARYGKDNYAPLRNAQLKALELENTGMAVILDTDKGTYNNIHPLGKETVAERLHLLAEKYVYGKNVICSGPIFERAEINGSEIKVFFKKETVGDGLCINNTYSNTAASLCEFEIASDKGYFVKAEARINTDNTVTVFSSEVAEPKYVRYAYSAVPANPNLFNKNGLPASPFTTEERVFSTSSFVSQGIEAEKSDVQIAEFSVTPMKNNINGVMGFTAMENSITAWNSCAITLRFKENGFFEYIDGSEFKTSVLPYEKGRKYDVKIIADFTDNTYSVIAEGILIAERARFRTGSLQMDNVGRFMVRGGDGEAAEEFFVENVKVIAPIKNTLIEAESAGETAVIAIVPEGRVYAAAYDTNTMTDVKFALPCDGVAILKIRKADKVFVWDKALAPLK